MMAEMQRRYRMVSSKSFWRRGGAWREGGALCGSPAQGCTAPGIGVPSPGAQDLALDPMHRAQEHEQCTV